ncbi:MAG: Holliday junction resolvase RuvX [Halanaerobiales bacterium]
MSDKKIYLGIDPGKDKCGIALVKDEENILLLDIVNAKRVDTYLKELYHKYDIDIVILGSGTYSEKIKKIIKKNFLTEIVIVDEKNTTREAQEKYREEHPPKGYKKILSKFVSWKPAENIDDYAALIIVKRYLENKL